MGTVSSSLPSSGVLPRAPRRFWPRSLRWRLQLWLTFLLVSVLAAMIATGYELQRVNRLRQIDTNLEIRVARLSGRVREVYRDSPPPRRGEEGRSWRPRPPERDGPGRGERRPPADRPPHTPPLPPPEDGERLGPDSRRLQLSAHATGFFNADAGYYFTIWYRDGSVVDGSRNAPPEIPPPRRGERDTLPHLRTRGALREALHCSGLGDCVLAGKSLDGDLAALRVFRWRLLAAGGVVLLLGLGVGWTITVRAIRPIEEISAAALRISIGNLSERIRIVDPDTEFGRLASVLNTTFSRLEAAFARQVQFTGDAAHELRTPLAVLISETQTALSRERTALEYRETVAGCLDIAQELRRLTATLLALARIDGSDSSVRRGSVDLAAAARFAAGRLRQQASERRVTIHCDLAPATAFSVRERVDQIVTNLLANAIHYNCRGGEIRLSTHTEDGSAVLAIADTGVGISVEHLPLIFDRFYRVDNARSRSAGHVGLGLAICKTLVEAERGAISVESVEHSGTTFSIRLPGAPIDSG